MGQKTEPCQAKLQNDEQHIDQLTGHAVLAIDSNTYRDERRNRRQTLHPNIHRCR
jgi:hypothetical protein